MDLFKSCKMQGVPRNMTIGEHFKCLLPLFLKLFDTKENNNKHDMAVLL